MDEATVQAEGGQVQWQSQAREQAGLSEAEAEEEIDTTNLHIDSTLLFSFVQARERSQNSGQCRSNRMAASSERPKKKK
jgi:hypothetical protein